MFRFEHFEKIIKRPDNFEQMFFWHYWKKLSWTNVLLTLLEEAFWEHVLLDGLLIQMRKNIFRIEKSMRLL